MLALRYLDVIVAVLAAVVAIALGAPALGCALGAGGWLLQRGIQAVDRRWAQQMSSPRAALGVSLFERFGRIWLLAGAMVIAGVVGARKDGLAAALIIFGAYSIRFVISLVSGPPAPTTPRLPAVPPVHPRPARSES